MTTRMKRSSIEALVVAILCALPCVLVIEGLLLPDILGVSMVPIGVFGISLWLNTYRIERRKHTPAIHS